MTWTDLGTPTPSEHYRKQPLVAEEEALRAVGGPVVTGGGGQRGKYYLYLRQNGLWTKEVTGFDPATRAGEARSVLPGAEHHAGYPPILMIHGTADTDVPYQKSAEMAAALAAQGVPHELITIEGGGHGLGNVSRAVRDDAYQRGAARSSASTWPARESIADERQLDAQAASRTPLHPATSAAKAARRSARRASTM